MTRCPDCESEDVVDRGEYIECLFCGAEFDIYLDDDEDLEEWEEGEEDDDDRSCLP